MIEKKRNAKKAFQEFLGYIRLARKSIDLSYIFFGFKEVLMDFIYGKDMLLYDLEKLKKKNSPVERIDLKLKE